jgi:cell division protein FtsI/penicillin-binding protein 2
MALVSATIANDGRRPRPTLDLAGDGAPSVRAVDAKTARTVERMMLDVVRHGTGTGAAVPGVAVAGKTGTAELRSTQRRCDPPPPAPEGGTPAPDGEACDAQEPDPTDTTAWFAAFAPAGSRTPRVALAVYLVGAGAGGDTAAPAARQVLQAALKR